MGKLCYLFEAQHIFIYTYRGWDIRKGPLHKKSPSSLEKGPDTERDSIATHR
jgi:hypothetical protein